MAIQMIIWISVWDSHKQKVTAEGHIWTLWYSWSSCVLINQFCLPGSVNLVLENLFLKNESTMRAHKLGFWAYTLGWQDFTKASWRQDNTVSTKQHHKLLPLQVQLALRHHLYCLLYLITFYMDVMIAISIHFQHLSWCLKYEVFIRG